MNRAYSVLNVKATTEDDDFYYIEGIASTPTPDRTGDIVEPMGAKFKTPFPLLWQHESTKPVGTVEWAKPTSKGIPVKARIPKVKEEGKLKERVDEAWQSVKYKLVAAFSIGFNALEGGYEILKNGGYRFKEWELLELSLVTIPANVEATITSFKSIDKAVLSALGKQNSMSKSVPSVIGSNLKGTNMKTLQELRDERTIKSARMEELLAADDMNDDEQVEFDALESEVKELDKEIRIKRFEYLNGSTAKPVNGKSTEQGKQSRAMPVKSAQKDDDFEGQSYTRLVIAKALANLDGVSASGVANHRWAKSNPTIAQILKANEVAGGGSGSGEWGAELVSADNRFTGDFIEYLYSMTVFDKLALRGIPANVSIKGQDGAGTGYWVGESNAIPATTADFSNVSLTPLKVAALAVVSNELLRDSSPSAERLVRDALVEASAQRVDSTFFSDAAAVAGVSPAGILNGLTALTSAGTDGTGLRNDVKALYRSFIAAKNASGLAFVMNPAQAKAISLLVNALGQYEFPQLNANGGNLLGDTVLTGDNIEGGHMILLKPSDIYKIGDGGVQVSISREATIAQNSSPVGRTDTPLGETQAWNNMFQTESTAIKVVRSINWAKRRASAVAYIRNIDYDGVES